MSNTIDGIDEFRCCPHIETSEGGRLPIVSVECEVQVNVVVATVRIKIVYRNTNNYTVSGVYKAPNSYGSATVTSCDVSYDNSHLVTAVVDPAVVSIDDAKKDPSTSRNYQDLLYFMLPFQNLGANSEIVVDLNYIQNLEFTPDGFYELIVPLYVAKHMTLPTAEIFSSVSCKLDVGTANCSWEVMTHAMSVVTQMGPYCSLRNTDSRVNNYFHLRLNALSNAISCSCCVQPNDATMNRPGGSFMTFVSPPENRYLPPPAVGRKMVFLFDRSGSMTGVAIQQAAAGLIQALRLLQPEDSFAICAFNHEEDWFLTPSDFDRFGGSIVPTLYSVTGDSVDAAIRWVGNIQAGGLTNILSPYHKATLLLSGKSGGSSTAINTAGITADAKIHPTQQFTSQLESLPFIFLLTDGAVQDEVSICQYAETHRKDTDTRNENSIRTFTFGIGPFVNPTFLKTLAAVGRGHSHINLHPSTLETSILGLMNKSTRPLLMDITLVIVSGGLSIEVYPFPIPDLFKGCPVAVAGAWTGTGAFPSTITVCGRMPGGEQLSFPVEVRTAETGFLNQALGSFRIDSIVSAYWMKQNNDKEKAGLKQKAIDASIEASIPCVFTQSVAYQTSEINQASDSSSSRQTKKKGTSNSAVMIGGTAILLGAAVGLMMFGNVGATNNNFNVSSALDSIANGAFDPGMFDAFKIPGIDIGSFFNTIGDGLGDAAGFIGGGLTTGVEAIQRVDLQDVPNAMGDIANNVGSPVDIGAPDCCDVGCCHIGDGCDGCCTQVGNCCDGSCAVAGSCCAGFGSCCESTCTGLEAVCGALDGLGSVGDFGGGCVVS